MTPKKDVSSKDYVSVINDNDSSYFIIWNKITKLYTLEDANGEHVLIYNKPIDDIKVEIEKLKELITSNK